MPLCLFLIPLMEDFFLLLRGDGSGKPRHLLRLLLIFFVLLLLLLFLWRKENTAYA